MIRIIKRLALNYRIYKIQRQLLREDLKNRANRRIFPTQRETELFDQYRILLQKRQAHNTNNLQ